MSQDATKKFLDVFGNTLRLKGAYEQIGLKIGPANMDRLWETFEAAWKEVYPDVEVPQPWHTTYVYEAGFNHDFSPRKGS